MVESEELMKMKEESEKVGSRNNIQKAKIMVSSPITSWQIDGETMEIVKDFIFLGSKITAGGDCSLENKRCLLLVRKAITNLDSILKSRDITLLTKVHVVKAVYCHPSHLTYMQSTSREIVGWKKHNLESRLLGEISITSDMQ